jgi:hypothetical protein
MILEGIVTSVGPGGAVNIAPMGSVVDAAMQRFLLRPFRTAQTYQNLKAEGAGVLHVSDDVLLLARAALGPVEPPPALFPAARVRGFVLQGACRFYEFRVRSLDDREERTRIEAEVVHCGRLRDFFGFNRAKHAVVEAAILATRTDFLPLADIEAEFHRLRVIVDKTGGDQEREAFAFLGDHVARIARSRGPGAGPDPPVLHALGIPGAGE